VAQAELIVLPYDSGSGRSLTHRLIAEFARPEWDKCRAAVAFINSSGNTQELLDATANFARRGKSIRITFGADTLGGEQGSEYLAVQDFLSALSQWPNVEAYLYHEPGRIFHPKVYFFENDRHALLIVGSSNWSHGGLFANIEANVALRLDLNDPADAAIRRKICDHFDTHWRSP
jgi:HKD family nuclease